MSFQTTIGGSKGNARMASMVRKRPEPFECEVGCAESGEAKAGTPAPDISAQSTWRDLAAMPGQGQA
jgi:hypothetical protein